MKVCKILTNRSHVSWPSWHLIHEWEDILSSTLNIPLEPSKPLEDKYHTIYRNRVLRKLLSYRFIRRLYIQYQKAFTTDCKALVFDLIYYPKFSYTNDINSLPIIIDFWKQKNLQEFNQIFKNCSLVLISSLEVFNYLQMNSCSINIEFFPLSISDKYQLASKQEKKHDIIFAGRRNPVLWNFMEMYEKKNPDIEYLYQVQIDGQLYYKSNKTGIIGMFHERNEYFNLLKRCRIGMYSTPGIDGGEERTGGFNPVTPRYLEYLAAGCLLAGRYPKTEEIDFFDLPTVCPNIESFEQFELVIKKHLTTQEVPCDVYKEILNKHYTSVRGKQLLTILKTHN